jgi:hypothetical protein
MKRQTVAVQENDQFLTLLCLFTECPDIATLITNHLFTRRRYLTKNRFDAIGFRAIYHFASVCKQTYHSQPFGSLLKIAQTIVLCDNCINRNVHVPYIARYTCPVDKCGVKLCKPCARKCIRCKQRYCVEHTRECTPCGACHESTYQYEPFKLQPYYRKFYCQDHGFPLLHSRNSGDICKYCLRDNREDISQSDEHAFEVSFSFASDEESDTETETSGLSLSDSEDRSFSSASETSGLSLSSADETSDLS